jgi:large subunit ribosomal protein L22
MAYEATHRFARISARKVRPVADLIRGKHADEALDILRYMPHRGARLLEKVLKSALGNAEDQRATNVQNLVVVDARVDGGPMFKRVRPRARGMAFMVKRRMAHIHIKVADIYSPTS